MKQLAAARAVITIWTENSVKSDWVRAEAGRAKAEGKLIPVKTAEVAYADIPLPFGEMHTENVASTHLIRAAIVAQLAKPAVTPSPFWQITSTFKYQVLTWIGIIGTAITVFAGFSTVLNLADWARKLVVHWHEWNQMVWGWTFSWLKIRVPPEIVPIISFIVSVGILVAGVNLSAQTVKLPVKLHPRKMRIFLGGMFMFLTFVPRLIFIIITIWEAIDNSDKQLVIWVLMAVICYTVVPLGYLLLFLEERSWVVANSLLFLFMSVCLLILPTGVYDILSMIITGSGPRERQGTIYEGVALLATLILLPTCWMAVILFSPLQQLTRRLGFAVLGVLLLIALSEISKLNLHQYLQPPKVSDNSGR